MEPNNDKYEDWSVRGDGGGGSHGHGSDEDDDNHSAGVPADIEMIVQAHETDDFWLSPTREVPQIKLGTHTGSKSSSTMTRSIRNAGGNDVYFGNQCAYICQNTMSSSARTK
jgi:hypothetical protein